MLDGLVSQVKSGRIFNRGKSNVQEGEGGGGGSGGY